MHWDSKGVVNQHACRCWLRTREANLKTTKYKGKRGPGHITVLKTCYTYARHIMKSTSRNHCRINRINCSEKFKRGRTELTMEEGGRFLRNLARTTPTFPCGLITYDTRGTSCHHSRSLNPSD